MKQFVLDLSFQQNGVVQTIHPVLLQQGQELVLVDVGYPGFLPLLQAAVQRHEFSLEDLTGLVITHHDIDHMGAAWELKEAHPQVRIYTAEMEAPYVSGCKQSLRLQQAEALLPSLPEEQRGWAQAFQEQLRAMRPVAVDATFNDGDELFFLPGVTVVATPGHMPGHFSLYLPGEKTLMAADAVVVENGMLDLANPHFALDLPAAVNSVRRLLELDIETIVCFHGGVVEKNVRQELAKLVQRYEN